MGGLSEGLVQEVGALAVEMDGALVVGQGLAVAGVGSSQEAGQPVHGHWAWDGDGKRGLQPLAEHGTSVPPAGTVAEVASLVPTVDLGDGRTCVNLLDTLDKILWQVLLGWERPGQSPAVRRGQPGQGMPPHQAPASPGCPVPGG